MTETFHILITDEVKSGAGGGGGGGGRSAAGVGAALGAGFGLMTELLSMVKDAIGNVLRPIRAMMVGIMKLLGELLRPVADMLLLVLQPVLLILKPFITLFKTFMAPFTAAAKEFSNISRTLISSGDTGGGISAAIQGVNALVAPFLISLTSVTLQLATSLLTGIITASVTNIANLLAGLADFLTFGMFTDKIAEFTNNFNSNIGSAMQATEQGINAGLTTATQAILGGLQTDVETQLQNLRETVNPQLRTALVETPGSMVTELGTKMKTDLGPGGTVPTTFSSGLDSMTTSTGTFKTKLESFASAVNNINFKTPSSSGSGRGTDREVTLGRTNFVIATVRNR